MFVGFDICSLTCNYSTQAASLRYLLRKMLDYDVNNGAAGCEGSELTCLNLFTGRALKPLSFLQDFAL